MPFTIPTPAAALLATLVFLFAACTADTYEGEEGGVQQHTPTSASEVAVTQPTPAPSPTSATLSHARILTEC